MRIFYKKIGIHLLMFTGESVEWLKEARHLHETGLGGLHADGFCLADFSVVLLVSLKLMRS